MKSIIFKCSNDRHENWIGRIVSLYGYGNLYEMVIESRSRILVVFGKTKQGRFACMPDFGVGSHLVDLKDEFWNTEMLIRELGPVDGITVASAFRVLKDEINI